jgi:nucleoid-associated protein YgaU
MPKSRYQNDRKIRRGQQLATPRYTTRLRQALSSGRLSTTKLVIKENERLDSVAGRVYGDGRYWWVIAVASGIGFAPQVPPGTELVIPNIADALALL